MLKDYNCCGGNPSGLSRLDRDVISHDGVKTVIVALGINDLGNYADDVSNVADITDGMRQTADKLHRAGLKVIWATLTPFEGTTLAGYYSLVKDAKRMQINEFIRTTPYFDGVVDFEKALADPANPLRMLPAYDSGDHLHPNDAGNAALAERGHLARRPDAADLRSRRPSVGAAVPATLALTLGARAVLRRVRPGRGARVHGLDDRDGHEHGGRRDAHRRRSRPPDERRVHARPAAAGRRPNAGAARSPTARDAHFHSGRRRRRRPAHGRLQPDPDVHALDDLGDGR